MMTEKKDKKVTKIAATEPLLKKPKGKRLKVAGYARVSTDNEEQQNIYEAQLDYYKKMKMCILGKINKRRSR